jgi:hypothetical protein
MVSQLLPRVRSCTKLLVIILVASAVLVPMPRIDASTNAYGRWTGYAMFGIYGANGIEVFQGYAANHESYYCPNDPAAYWAFGTSFQLHGSDYVPTKGIGGATTNRQFFYLEDAGDTSCSQGNYWVDAYFGRYEPDGPRQYYCGAWGQSYNGVPNNCDDAKNWGYWYLSYTSSS